MIIFSPYFQLKCGTRQVCPLSPLLFALSVEPLNTAIWSDDEIQHHQGESGTKDLPLCWWQILFISCPAISPPWLLFHITQFGTISACKLNINRFLIRFFSLNVHSSAVPNKFKYLVITVTQKSKDLCKKNLIFALEHTKLDIGPPTPCPSMVVSILLNQSHYPHFCIFFSLYLFPNHFLKLSTRPFLPS